MDKNGVDWTRDLIGACPDLECNDDLERYEMSEEAFEYGKKRNLRERA